MPCEKPIAIWNGTMLTRCAMPMAATGSEPYADVKLLRIVMPVTFKRFWMEAGMPTPHTPLTICLDGRNMEGLMHTYVLPRFTNSSTKK